MLKLVQEPDVPYNELHDILTSGQYRIEKLHLERFESGMTKFAECGIEYLLDLCDTDIMAESIIKKSGSQIGIIGYFLRRSLVSASKLRFTEMKTLLKNICDYYTEGEFLAFSLKSVLNLL